MSQFSDWIRTFPGPVVGFGPRQTTVVAYHAAQTCGKFVALQGRVAFSGGAKGCDLCFIVGANKGKGVTRVFRPKPGSGIPGLFARSRLALETAHSLGGGALIFVPAGARKGGSLASLRMARAIGLPLFIVWVHPGETLKVEIENG